MHNQEQIDSDDSEKSTQDYGLFPFDFYFNEESKIRLNQNDVAFPVQKNDEQKMLNLINDIFSKRNKIQEIEELSDGKENYFLQKKYEQEHLTSNNFSIINKVKKNETGEKIFEINKILKTSPNIYRLDYYKKIFIKSFLNFLVNKGKELINNCNISEKIQKYKLHKPNYKLYAGNPKKKDNKLFLNKKIKEVFMDYDKKCEKGTSRQKRNEKLIEIIYKSIKFPISEQEENLINFFEMTIEKGIEMYYDSDEFEQFKNNKTNKEYDKCFYKEKNRNFSLFEKNGFIRLVNMPFYSKVPK